jgi:putative NIF3 family GTP cyclohydrolase 1 type 2
MKIRDIARRLETSIPDLAAANAPEPYGAYHVDRQARIARALYCVAPSVAVLDHFRSGGYDVLISHQPLVVGVPQLVFHAALAACPGGLADQWSRHLELSSPVRLRHGTAVAGQIAPTTLEKLVAKVSLLAHGRIDGAAFQRRGAAGEAAPIRSVAVCTGRGGALAPAALALGVDCLILGEASRAACEMGFRAVVEVGRTRSAWMGVRLFRELLPELTIDAAPLALEGEGREAFLAGEESAVDRAVA